MAGWAQGSGLGVGSSTPERRLSIGRDIALPLTGGAVLALPVWGIVAADWLDALASSPSPLYGSAVPFTARPLPVLALGAAALVLSMMAAAIVFGTPGLIGAFAGAGGAIGLALDAFSRGATAQALPDAGLVVLYAGLFTLGPALVLATLVASVSGLAARRLRSRRVARERLSPGPPGIAGGPGHATTSAPVSRGTQRPRLGASVLALLAAAFAVSWIVAPGPAFIELMPLVAIAVGVIAVGLAVLWSRLRTG